MLYGTWGAGQNLPCVVLELHRGVALDVANAGPAAAAAAPVGVTGAQGADHVRRSRHLLDERIEAVGERRRLR